MAFVTRTILALEQEADRLGEEEAQGKADHDTGEALVVSRRVSPVSRVRIMNALSFRSTTTPDYAGVYLRIEQKSAGDIAQGIPDKGPRRVHGLLGVAGCVGRSQANALDPSRREEVDQVEAKDSTANLLASQLPASAFVLGPSW